MKEYAFEVTREMIGDRSYVTGDTRKLTAVDAMHLVRSKALVPKGKEAEEAMEEILGNEPAAQSEVIQSVKGDAPNNKELGNAANNKANGNAPANKGKGAKVAATARAAAQAPALPAVPNIGQPDPNAGQTSAPPATFGADGQPVAGGATGDAGPPQPADQAALPDPAVPPVKATPGKVGKRR